MADRTRRNPFDPARIAEETFVGRRALLAQLGDELTEGKSFALISPRHMGKTSLLRELQRRIMVAARQHQLSPLPLPVYVSCERDHHCVEDILVSMCYAVADALSSHYGLFCPPERRRQALGDAEQGRLNRALDTLAQWSFAQDHASRRVIVLLDALHRLDGTSILPALDAKLYALVDRGRINVLLARRQPSSVELRNDVSRLDDLLTQQFPLGPLRPDETQALVDIARQHGWRVGAGVAAQLHRLTDGHPYRLQYYLHALLGQGGALTRDRILALHTEATIHRLNNFLVEPTHHASTQGASIFVSYSRKDEREKEQLMTHLGVLEHAHHAVPWCGTHIGVGADWKRVIQQAMDAAQVAVLLVSANFLTSDFILHEEIPQLLARHRSYGMHIVPVIAQYCDWQAQQWLATLNVRPKNGTPVWRDGGIHADKDLADIIHEIRRILDS